MQWAFIEGDPFVMMYSNEVYAHDVDMHGFHLAKTETTMRQYLACVEAGCCTRPKIPGPSDICVPPCLCYWDDWVSGDPAYNGEQPVNCVTWTQAREYCKWIGARLPSDAEWEYAARSGGKEQLYPWGEEKSSCEYVVMDLSTEENDYGCGRMMPWEVCSKPKGNSEQGVCDLLGNVWEWLEDDCHPSYEGAPTDGSAWVGDPRGNLRAHRGDCWYSGFAYATDFRGCAPPEVFPRDTKGFRCAR